MALGYSKVRLFVYLIITKQGQSLWGSKNEFLTWAFMGLLKQPRNKALERVKQTASLEALSPFVTSLTRTDVKTFLDTVPLQPYGAGTYLNTIYI